ncbi:MAG: hypothetical protein PVJ41_09120 [Desulfobacterales bacterium]|jgi:uncharacterized protein (DUF302 family)
MRSSIFALILIVAFALPVSAEPGLTSVKSAHDVKNTVDRLESALREKGMTIF